MLFVLRQLCSVLFFCLLIAPSSVLAGVYICRDASGSVSYTNIPTLAGCKPLNAKRSRESAESFWRPDSGRYDSLIRRASARYGVEFFLLKAMIRTESNFRYRAVSHKGAQGLMQLMPRTAKEVRVRNSFDPWDNVSGGARYFRRQLDSFNGNVILSLAAYNAGPTLVRRLGRVPHNGETERYVKKVMYHYRMYTRYGAR